MSGICSMHGKLELLPKILSETLKGRKHVVGLRTNRRATFQWIIWSVIRQCILDSPGPR